MFSLSSRRFGGAELELPVRLVAAEEIDATEQIIRKLLDAGNRSPRHGRNSATIRCKRAGSSAIAGSRVMPRAVDAVSRVVWSSEEPSMRFGSRILIFLGLPDALPRAGVRAGKRHWNGPRRIGSGPPGCHRRGIQSCTHRKIAYCLDQRLGSIPLHRSATRNLHTEFHLDRLYDRQT